MPERKIPFFEFFAAYRPGTALTEQLSAWLVCQAEINPKERTMSARLECPTMPEEGMIPQVEQELAAAYEQEK